jgi:hypothetical protein
LTGGILVNNTDLELIEEEIRQLQMENLEYDSYLDDVEYFGAQEDKIKEMIRKLLGESESLNLRMHFMSQEDLKGLLYETVFKKKLDIDKQIKDLYEKAEKIQDEMK